MAHRLNPEGHKIKLHFKSKGVSGLVSIIETPLADGSVTGLALNCPDVLWSVSNV